MGQQQSKEEVLYQHARNGNIEGIQSLSAEGANLEWVDKEGKTPLTVACMDISLYNVAKTLLDLGADVNAYAPGRQGGTPLHHAARRGLENTVKLLLSFRANALIINDACQTPVELARAAGHNNVVHAIENHICLFSGWMREFYGPEFLEVLAPQLLSRKVWVVILPCGSRNAVKPFRLELALYSSSQDAQPRAVIPLWKSNLEDHKLQEADPSVVIVDNSPISKGRRRRRSHHISWEARCRLRKSRVRLRLGPANDYDRQQLQLFCNACKGIPQPKVVRPQVLHNYQTPANLATVPPGIEDLELVMAMNASIQSAMQEGPHVLNPNSSSEAGTSTSGVVKPPSPPKLSTSQWTMHEARHGFNAETVNDSIPATQITPSPNVVPSAPPVVTEIDQSVDNEMKEGNHNSSCVICLDAPVEGACVPCGHMAGCMSCLNEIKAKNWGCPVCRHNISQVIKLYSV